MSERFEFSSVDDSALCGASPYHPGGLPFVEVLGTAIDAPCAQEN